MADTPPEPDLDEKFSLYPLEGEEVLERILGVTDGDEQSEEDEAEDS